MKKSEKKQFLQSIQSCFVCPISQQAMKNPVLTMDGQTYEKKEIEKWLKISLTSPTTNLNLESGKLIPNFILKNIIQKFKNKPCQIYQLEPNYFKNQQGKQTKQHKQFKKQKQKDKQSQFNYLVLKEKLQQSQNSLVEVTKQRNQLHENLEWQKINKQKWNKIQWALLILGVVIFLCLTQYIFFCPKCQKGDTDIEFQQYSVCSETMKQKQSQNMILNTTLRAKIDLQKSKNDQIERLTKKLIIKQQKLLRYEKQMKNLKKFIFEQKILQEIQQKQDEQNLPLYKQQLQLNKLQHTKQNFSNKNLTKPVNNTIKNTTRNPASNMTVKAKSVSIQWGVLDVIKISVLLFLLFFFIWIIYPRK